MVNVKLCMGSSCYARGNREILEILEIYLEENQLQQEVTIVGAHCLGNCASGPIIEIGEKPYQGLHPSCIIDILKYHMGEAQ